MSTYNLYPGLKQILEDKRIRKFGVPERYFSEYLMAEQFVIDLRDISDDDATAIDLTFADLVELKLDKMPYPKTVLHCLTKYNRDYTGRDIAPKIGIVSYFFAPEGNVEAWRLFDNPVSVMRVLDGHKNSDLLAMDISYLTAMKRSLIVMLATRNAIKDRHEVKRSQTSKNGIPHKKGSGGYTVIRPPSAQELSDEESDSPRHVRPHLRRGHIRKLHPFNQAKWIWVSPCFVNGMPNVQRTSYLNQRSIRA